MLKKQRDFLRIRHAKEYIDGVRKNPLFFKAPPKRWVVAGVGALIVMCSIAGIIGLTYIPAFQLTEISVTGTMVLDRTEMQRHVEDFIRSHGYPFISKHNAYLMNVAAIEADLLQNFALDGASVQHDGRTIVVDVKEKIMTIALRTKEKTMFLDVNGSYVRDATAEESRAIDVRIGSAVLTEGETLVPLQSDMPIILDTQNDPATTLAHESVTHVLDIVTSLKQRGILIKTFTFDGATALFTRVDTNQSYDIYFDLNASIAEQMSVLAAILTKPGFTEPSEYIDLRFGAYVYVK